jgi:hypothetical protein
MPRQASSTASVQRGPRQSRWASGFIARGSAAGFPARRSHDTNGAVSVYGAPWTRRAHLPPCPTAAPAAPLRLRRRLVLGVAADRTAARRRWPFAARASPMTDGPFYPPRAWREQWPDWDADLSRVQRGGQTQQARGEHLGWNCNVADTRWPRDRRRRGRDLAVRRARRLPPPGRAPRAGQLRPRLPGLRRQRAAAATARALSHHPAGALPRAHAAHPRQAAPPRASASSPRSCSWPATPATRATSCGASSTPADRAALADAAAASRRPSGPALAGAAHPGAAGA